jgi:hypothetical protein
VTKLSILLLAAPALSAAALTRPAVPLCDRDDAPACGNIGQPGRPVRVQAETSARPLPPLAPAAVASELALADTVQLAARPLLTAARGAVELISATRPRVDREQRPACGNVMSKGGGPGCK